MWKTNAQSSFGLPDPGRGSSKILLTIEAVFLFRQFQFCPDVPGVLEEADLPSRQLLMTFDDLDDLIPST
ncbi:UNVERIFIED_CONTAM: hypothetical protein FKN15_050302 [Acipenser sinensis]